MVAWAADVPLTKVTPGILFAYSRTANPSLPVNGPTRMFTPAFSTSSRASATALSAVVSEQPKKSLIG